MVLLKTGWYRTRRSLSNNQLNSFIVFNMTHHCVKSASVASAAERTPTATKLDESHRHKKFSRDNSFSWNTDGTTWRKTLLLPRGYDIKGKISMHCRYIDRRELSAGCRRTDQPRLHSAFLNMWHCQWQIMCCAGAAKLFSGCSSAMVYLFYILLILFPHFRFVPFVRAGSDKWKWW